MATFNVLYLFSSFYLVCFPVGLLPALQKKDGAFLLPWKLLKLVHNEREAKLSIPFRGNEVAAVSSPSENFCAPYHYCIPQVTMKRGDYFLGDIVEYCNYRNVIHWPIARTGITSINSYIRTL